MEEKQAADASAPPQVNPGYASFHLAKALTTGESHEDPAVRENARQKVEKWLGVIGGLLSGRLAVGSRTPVKDAPAWATPEVVTGGFATGGLLAGGPLLPHERALLARVAPSAKQDDARRALNTYFLTDPGMAELRGLLNAGRYDVAVPEEGALLVVTWLADHGLAGEARELVATLAPYFDRLRFYPVPTDRPRRRSDSRVFVQDVDHTVKSLRRVKPQAAVLAQQEAVRVWAPLYDRAVALFIETVEGDVPTLPGGGGRPSVKGDKYRVVGGWPCQKYPDGWQQRARALLGEYDALREVHRLSGRPDRAGDSFAPLRACLRRCVEDPARLTGREVGKVRLVVARYVAKRGTPDSAGCRAARRQHAADVAAPPFTAVAGVLVPRLEPHPPDDGVEDVAPLTAPVTADESRRTGVPAGTPVPPSLRRKVERCLRDTAAALVERGVISSGEALARVLPQRTSGLRAAGIDDPALRDLYAAVYRAFRRRRSLLLLNLERQVGIGELPWAAAAERRRRGDAAVREATRQALRELAVLALTAFPHAIVPNKLVRELRALARDAALDLPLTEEVAADIFMGRFSGQFVAAAHGAADLLDGTLYATYYGIDYRLVRQIPVPKKQDEPPARWGDPPDALAALCMARAGVAPGTYGAAANGTVIEQQQVLTTHNLATLVAGLGLEDALRERMPAMARECFQWVCARLQVKADRRHANLVALKNAAYAWRQMVFYLALMDRPAAEAFLPWARDHLGRQREPFPTRFRPALAGLELAARGAPEGDAAEQHGARRFLGWTTGPHWLSQ